MDQPLNAALDRIAEALERLAPRPPASLSFQEARIYRHDPAADTFIAAPDYRLALDLLVGIDRQKARVLEALRRFASDLPANHILLWGVRGAGKSSLAKAAFMAAAGAAARLQKVEEERR